MNTTLKFLKVTAGGVALAIALSSVGLSATRTWTGSGANGNWGNSTNWTGGIPTAADTAAFGNSSRYLVNVNTNRAVNSLTFSGTGAYSFTGNAITIGAGGINNNITNNTVLFGQTVVAGDNLVLTGSGTAARLDFAGNLAGTVGKVVTVQNVSVDLDNNTSIIAPSITVGTGGYLTARGTGGTSAVPESNGLGDVIVNNNAVLDVTATAFVLADTYTANNGGTTRLDLAYTAGPNGAYIQTNDAITLGGDLALDWGAASLTNQASFNVGDKWNLFKAGTTLSGNFSSVALENVGGSNAFSGFSTFVQNGNDWSTALTPNAAGQWLVFQSQTGNLVVVPEPSTMVFAGVGVAMAGWSAWKKRRMAKLLGNG